MTFESPVLELRKGSGEEASAEQSAVLREAVRSGTLPTREEFLDAYPQFSTAACTFLSGSLVEGWGNVKSDIDAFVVTEQAEPPQSPSLLLMEESVSTQDPTVWIALGQLGPFRVDIEVWHVAQIDELVSRFVRPTEDGRNHYQGYTGSMSLHERDLFYRLCVGRPLTGSDWWERQRQAIVESDYALWLAEDHKVGGENRLEDVLGMLSNGDARSAALAAREAFIIALSAVLAAHGDICPSRKWLPQRLERHQPPEISSEEAWRVLSMAGCVDSPGEWASETARLCHRLFLAVERALTDQR
ncbi:hypothetical protein [Streptomyces sp. NBC_01716]|uniref:hypothetical protein n=1 Tax=Streptomyces sp. NBC_01716 TaxID=2975917 RepID=UPI002E330A27|nr:hypothetical protein [Streptomyces sp. NBC_01716]